ncbi:tRNA (adenosine(37)-N6)-threonylcarbamoyltransferase complex ATPase subunit type 1 TsaE [bacterium]|nr:tRNA (adenosine(37)-N6)-threonylcarbamoyltransferase complex ATPase subunit type 1 TsaE [bacterium]
MIVELKTQEMLENFGWKLGKSLKGNELIGLKGPLGAGKTTLTKAIALALNVKENIISPTFNIIKVYDSPLAPLYHIDCYRLENMGYDPILDDYIFDENAIRIIEWYNFLNDDELFKNAIKIEISVKEDNTRVLNIEGDICID